ncbi:MAG: HlyD family efflux transporter periplasmic adaptor subunit [Acidobacteriota bacterium]
MHRLGLLAFLILTGALIALFLPLPKDAGPAIEAEPLAEAPPLVHALGRLEPTGTILKVGVPAGNEASCVAELAVEEGQRVNAGQVLAVMDSFATKAARMQEANAQVEAARARLRQSAASAKEAELDAARAEVQRLVHRIRSTRRTQERMAALLADGVVAAETVDATRSAVAEARQEHRRALARLSGLEQVRSVDLDLRRAEISVARATAAIAAADLDTARVLAPRAGTVLKIHARPGELPGVDGLLELGDVSRLQAVAEVFEGDIQRVQIGRAATVELFSTGDTFRGRVAAIGSIVGRMAVLTNDPVSDTDARVVEVRIDLEEEAIETLRGLSNARVLVHIEATGPSSPAAAGDAR